MTNGLVMSLVEMLNSQFPVTRPQPVTEADMTPEEIKLAEISEAKQAEEETKKLKKLKKLFLKFFLLKLKLKNQLKKLSLLKRQEKPDLNTIKWTAIFKFIH